MTTHFKAPHTPLGERQKQCRTCGFKRLLKEFPKQSDPEPKRRTVGDGHRRDCKKCHSKKVRKCLERRLSKEEISELYKRYHQKYKVQQSQ